MDAAKGMIDEVTNGSSYSGVKQLSQMIPLIDIKLDPLRSCIAGMPVQQYILFLPDDKRLGRVKPGILNASNHIGHHVLIQREKSLKLRVKLYIYKRNHL